MMNHRKYLPIVFSLVFSCILVIGLQLLLGGLPEYARAAPGDLFVTTGGSGSDCTQVNPCSLPNALSQSNHDDTIYVAQGTYTSTGTEVISITKNVTLFGGWDGSATSPPVRDREIYTTTLDGQNGRRGVFISGDISPVLDGFIITRGNASTAATDPGYGGGIYSSEADPIITNNVITNNVAFTDPSIWAQGGGIYIQLSDGSPTGAVISDNQITNNIASPHYRGKGGGLNIRTSSDIVISDNTIQDNIAGSTSNGMGGGLSLNDCTATVRGNLIQDNGATPGVDGFGGGFFSEMGKITLESNHIINNTAEYGAITFEHNSNVTLTNNIVAQNPGGGIFFRGSAVLPLSGTLAHNTIVENGREGIYVGYFSSGNSSLTLTNNIITGHTTGILVYSGPNPNVVTATHTLFYDNNFDIAGATITSTNVITGSDPLFMNATGWRYHLGINSPAIDAGTPVSWVMTDIDGEPRPLPAGGDSDIGADETDWRQFYLPLIAR